MVSKSVPVRNGQKSSPLTIPLWTLEFLVSVSIKTAAGGIFGCSDGQDMKNRQKGETCKQIM